MLSKFMQQYFANCSLIFYIIVLNWFSNEKNYNQKDFLSK